MADGATFSGAHQDQVLRKSLLLSVVHKNMLLCSKRKIIDQIALLQCKGAICSMTQEWRAFRTRKFAGHAASRLKDCVVLDIAPVPVHLARPVTTHPHFVSHQARSPLKMSE